MQDVQHQEKPWTVSNTAWTFAALAFVVALAVYMGMQ
jgi:hypothetical protein